MENEDLVLEKIQLRTANSCLRITPYMEFKNGTKGSVLLLGFNVTDSMLFLFNSPERNDDNEHGKDNSLSSSEVDMFYNYRQVCIREFDGYYRISPELYEKYGVVLLAGKYLSAHIADFFCDNINQQKSRPFNYPTDRVSHLISEAVQHYRISEIEDDITDFFSNESQWRRDIILQALHLYNADEVFENGLHIDWIQVRNTYVGWLEREKILFKLYFAQEILKAYHNVKEPINWRELLEKALSDKLENKISFRYSQYGVQEIIGLYALCKYLYREKPEYLKIQYAHVDAKERISIYQDYFAVCKKEMLDELNTKDDPYRTELPTEQEAEEKAKLKIATLVGRSPLYLTKEQATTYAMYEEGFCAKHSIVCMQQPEENLALAQHECPGINAMEYYDDIAPDISYNIACVKEESDGKKSIISRSVYVQKNGQKFEYIISSNEDDITTIHKRIEKHLSSPAKVRDELLRLQKEKLVSLPMDNPTCIIRAIQKIWGERAPKERSFVTTWVRRVITPKC